MPTSPALASPEKSDAALLEKLHDAFVEAFKSNDLKVLGEFYMDDAVLLPPGRPMVSGRSAIVAFWQNAERIQDLVFEATDVRALGGQALREAGNLLVTLRGRGRETRNAAAKYTALWLQVDGGWKLDSTVWNGVGLSEGGGGGRQGGGGGGGRRGGGGRARPGGGGGCGQRGGRARQGGQDG